MAKYVIEDTTLTGIADAIRAKAGTTGPIAVTDMATQIAAITGGGTSEGGSSGGGSVEGIVYVTFMNGDVELCKTACMAGDSTIDPVEDGKIAAPTKDPTVDTVYTYAGGWSLTDGGTADVTALVDVSEDRVVYAAYTESVREYTVNFYDDDGTTLLESLQVPYGQVPSPAEPVKTGYYFKCWTPELTAVTGDADYAVSWTQLTGAWAVVAQAVANGTYKSVYAVGDVVPIDLGDYGVHNMEIVAFDADEKADGSGKAAISWLSQDCITQRVMNSVRTVENGWAAAELRTWLQSDVFAALPAEVQSAIVPVTKTYYDYTTSSTLSCGDTVWVPSTLEVFGSSGRESSGCTYTGYFTDAASRMKSYNGSASRWWTRSAASSVYFGTVGREGEYDGIVSANNSATDVAIGFCT